MDYFHPESDYKRKQTPLIYVVERGLEFDEVSMTHAVHLPPKLEIDADAVSVGQSSTDLTMLLLKLNYSQQIA